MDGSSNADVNPLGPVHEYVAPATVLAVKFNVDPAHTGPLFAAVGVAGMAFTVTAVVAAELVHPETVTVAEYVPALTLCALVKVGSSNDEVNPLGPVHAYVAPATVLAERFIVEPAHTGLLLETVGADGIVFTVTAVVPAALVQPLTVTVTE